MRVSISSKEYFSKSLIDIEALEIDLGSLERKISRTRTLSGKISSTDFGFNEKERNVSVVVSLGKEQTEIAESMLKKGGLFYLSTPNHSFECLMNKVSRSSIGLTISMLVEKQF